MMVYMTWHVPHNPFFATTHFTSHTKERVSSNSEAMLGKRKSVDFDQDEMLPVTKKPASATPSVPKIKLQQGSTSPLSHAAVTKLMPPSSSRPLSPTERSPLKPLMMDKQLNSQPPSKTKPVVLEFSSLIAAFLDIESLCQFSKVNQEFHHVSKAEDLWKRLCISDTMFGVVHLENFIRMFNMTWRTAYPIVRGLDERSQGKNNLSMVHVALTILIVLFLSFY